MTCSFQTNSGKTRQVSPKELHKQKEAGAVGNREKTAMLRQVIFIFPVRTNARNAQDEAALPPRFAQLGTVENRA
ncbi:hypothetical protein RvVAT039_29320 [Agrobacterium vitis]|nr:hypothetical protein RvVAT039_29320 [Agrobacterium vitis]